MILTTLHRCKNTIRYKRDAGSKTWVIIGRTTAWANEQAPPAVTPDANSIEEPICAVKAVVSWVVLDPNGTIQFIDENGQYIYFTELTTEQQVLDQSAQLIMLSGTVSGAQTGNVTFRQLGFSTDLVPAAGHENDSFLLDADVSSYGQLESIENRTPVNIIPTSQYELINLIEF